MQHRKESKRIKEVQSRRDYSTERSPYWDFMAAKQTQNGDSQSYEEATSNPDVLSEQDNLFKPRYATTDEYKFKIETIKAIIPKLSKMQQRLLSLCGMQDQSLADAARKLNISKGVAQEYLDEARKKIIRYYNTKRAQAILKGEL